RPVLEPRQLAGPLPRHRRGDLAADRGRRHPLRRRARNQRHLRGRDPPAARFHGLEGMKHMPTALVPAIYDPGLADLTLEIATEAAHAMVRRLARTQGLLVGVSAGAAVCGALAVAGRAAPGSVVVTVLPDGGDKYLSERFWSQP